jgi:hypothetical protein
MQRGSAVWRTWLVVAALPLALLVSACETTLPIGVTPSPTATLTPTPAPPRCPTLAGFGRAGAATTGSGHFASVPFPAHSISYLDNRPEINGYQYRLVRLCTENSDLTAIRSFYAKSAPAAGWTQTSIFPLRGDPSATCGDPYCWKRGSGPTLYFGLEFLTGEGNNGSAVTYNLRLIIPPLSGGNEIVTAGNHVNLDTGAIIHEPTSAGDIAWDAAIQVTAVGSARFSPTSFPASSGADLATVSHAQLVGLAYTLINPPAPTIFDLRVLPIKTNGGHLSKLIVGGAGSSAIQIWWLTYAFGF